MIALASCSESIPQEQNASITNSLNVGGRLDSILHWPFQPDHIVETEMSELDRAVQYTSQYTYYIDNDTIVISQFMYYLSNYFWSDEEMYYQLHLRLPLDCARRGLELDIEPSDELHLCGCRPVMWHSAFGADEAKSITGSIALLALEDSTLTFRQDISVIALDSSVFPNVYRYRGMETALYWRDDSADHPWVPHLRRRVVR